MLRAQRGDVRAFEQLVEPHRDVMFRVAYLIVRNAADAEDAAQDALLKTWRALGRFRRDAPLRPWLVTIAANEARNRRRGAGRRERLALRATAPNAAACSTLSSNYQTRSGSCSSAVTCSRYPRRKPRLHSASAAAPSSHAPPERSNG